MDTLDTRVEYATLNALRDIANNTIRESCEAGLPLDLELSKKAYVLGLYIDHGIDLNDSLKECLQYEC